MTIARRSAITRHRPRQALTRRPAIPPLRDNTLYHFAGVIHSAPSIMGRPVDPDTHLIKRPAPQRIASMMHTAFPDLRGKHWTNAVPPVPHGLMADVDAALTQTDLRPVSAIQGSRTYILTARRMTSGELVKERQGVCITRGDEAVRPGSSRFTLTMPAV